MLDQDCLSRIVVTGRLAFRRAQASSLKRESRFLILVDNTAAIYFRFLEMLEKLLSIVERQTALRGSAKTPTPQTTSSAEYMIKGLQRDLVATHLN